MGEFFKPWRRKLGVVTLMMALVFMAGWVRSCVVVDGIAIPMISHIQEFVSVPEGLAWVTTSHSEDSPLADQMTDEIRWGTEERYHDGISYDEFERDLHNNFSVHDGCSYHAHQRHEIDWRFIGFVFNAYFWDVKPAVGQSIVIIPYWMLVIPLTLLSAYLLFSKPRKSIQKKIAEPIPVEGA